MKIWFRDYTLEDLRMMEKGIMLEHIGIEYTEIGDDYIVARMPVDHRTFQPGRILHGGASVVLAESLGSSAAYLTVDTSRYTCMGLEINANHVRPVSSGYVYGTARPIHIGRKTQVWGIEIKNEEGKITCISRITIFVSEFANL